jgi:hypothetical protein
MDEKKIYALTNPLTVNAAVGGALSALLLGGEKVTAVDRAAFALQQPTIAYLAAMGAAAGAEEADRG